MAKKARINGKQFYSKKNIDYNIFCGECARLIVSKYIYYCSENPDRFICNYCYGKLRKEALKCRKDRACIIETNTIIHVGIKENQCELFGNFYKNDKGDFLLLPIAVSKDTGCVTITHKTYEKHKDKLKNYSFINNKTGKPFIDLKFVDGFIPGSVKNRTVKIDTPNSVSWAVKHPFQGGKFSGK